MAWPPRLLRPRLRLFALLREPLGRDPPEPPLPLPPFPPLPPPPLPGGGADEGGLVYQPGRRGRGHWETWCPRDLHPMQKWGGETALPTQCIVESKVSADRAETHARLLVTSVEGGAAVTFHAMRAPPPAFRKVTGETRMEAAKCAIGSTSAG